jgi:hypothetical protein
MNLRQAGPNGVVLLLSVVVGLVVCEAGARLVLNPADYLSVTMVPDNVLGMTIAPNSAGMDEWGFRNRIVPPTVDVVAVGDSHTFGNTARMNDAWPSVLGRETDLSVYNLGLGGYGPNQYYHLLTTRGLTLHPKWVLCGLYMGDDFENAFSITYGLEHWSFLRKGQWGDIEANIWGDSEPPGLMKAARNWLSRESVTYRVAVHGPVLGTLKESLRFRRAQRNQDPSVTSLVVEDQRIREAFRPIGMARRLDQSSPEVKEGMRITFHLLKEMDRVCRERGCIFAVIIIPTKETVFADYLQRAEHLHLKDAIDMVITNERLARKEVGQFLEYAGIPYVDTLGALRQAVGEELYARTTADMHPSENGYKVIASTATEFLRRSRSRS